MPISSCLHRTHVPCNMYVLCVPRSLSVCCLMITRVSVKMISERSAAEHHVTLLHHWAINTQNSKKPNESFKHTIYTKQMDQGHLDMWLRHSAHQDATAYCILTGDNGFESLNYISITFNLEKNKMSSGISRSETALVKKWNKLRIVNLIWSIYSLIHISLKTAKHLLSQIYNIIQNSINGERTGPGDIRGGLGSESPDKATDSRSCVKNVIRYFVTPKSKFIQRGSQGP